MSIQVATFIIPRVVQNTQSPVVDMYRPAYERHESHHGFGHDVALMVAASLDPWNAWRECHFTMWPMTDNTNNQDYSSDSSEEDVLRAVLEFVETFDTAHTTTHDAANQIRQARTRKRHSSERIKMEIHALRDLAKQMEDRVAHLQYEQVARQNAAREAPAQWELEAMRQEEQRLRAEMENLELKRLVKTQSIVAHRLEYLFQQHTQRQDTSLATNPHGEDLASDLFAFDSFVLGTERSDASDPNPQQH